MVRTSPFFPSLKMAGSAPTPASLREDVSLIDTTNDSPSLVYLVALLIEIFTAFLRLFYIRS